MIQTNLSIVVLFFLSFSVATGQDNGKMTDSTFQLDEAVVESFGYNRNVMEVPLAFGSLRAADLSRFSNTSFLPAVNMIAGVRMEERSPGSYRFSIRGSSMRSPFGVRNIKFYWNGLPLTDAGGNTYINILDFNSIDELEIIKGPGSSLYGAGNGGVVLLKNVNGNTSSVNAGVTVGSYGLRSYALSGVMHNEVTTVKLQHSHFESDGYRNHTAMVRDVFQGRTEFVTDHGTLSTNFLYTDLKYETPGALTVQQFTDDPKQARPAGGPNAGAIEQRAAIFNKTFYAAMHHVYQWNNHWSNQTGLYGSFTNFNNPAIRNYERRSEQGFGMRTNTDFLFGKGKLSFGAEFQHGFSPIGVYENLQGKTGSNQFSDEITTNTYLVFAQTEFYLPANFFLTIGASLNKLEYNFIRLSTVPAVEEDRNFKPVVSPRIALLKKIDDNFSVYTSFSQGYSPPTIQELYPSAGTFDANLNPEKGNNIEAGLKGNFFSQKMKADITAYLFELDNTIVIRRLEDGGEYFVNAGKTAQRGVEAKLSWGETYVGKFVTSYQLWSSYTHNDYTFKNYYKDLDNLSGNSLTGIAPHLVTAGIDLITRPGLYSNFTFSYTDEIPLDDENLVYANGYHLLGARIGFRKKWRRLDLDVFTGIDNILDEQYSLGNDLNAAGGRYFNAAPGINVYSGTKIGLIF